VGFKKGDAFKAVDRIGAENSTNAKRRLRAYSMFCLLGWLGGVFTFILLSVLLAEVFDELVKLDLSIAIEIESSEDSVDTSFVGLLPKLLQGIAQFDLLMELL